MKHFDMAEALLKLGANSKAQTLSGCTPINLATPLGKLDEIKNHIKGHVS
ncbi:MAG: hypothetical protein IBJ00_03835 [Alphaproteobacteria bacterium]|nr:hypothetical protein [Alphaproteobacteria bacterium]